MYQRIGATACSFAIAGFALACGGGDPDVAQSNAAPKGVNQTTAASSNRAPEIASVSIEPAEPMPGERLVASVESSDPDGDKVSLRYEWRIDGVTTEGQGDSFVLESGEKGGRIEVVVTASDGELQVTKQAAVRVGNQRPVLQAIVLEPLDEVRAGRDVEASPRGTDPDGDEVSYEYTWSVNGATVPGAGARLSHEHYARGDTLQVRVIASDGVSESEPLESAAIPVVNAPPRITSRPGALEDGKFRYAITAEDPDGDTQFRYRLLQGPEGMALQSGGTVVWSPEEAQVGEHEVEVEITDAKGGVASQRFVISLAFEDAGSVPAAAAE